MPPQPAVQNFLCALRTCRREGHQLSALSFRAHLSIVRYGWAAHKSMRSPLVYMLLEDVNMCNASRVFDQLVFQNECCWSSLIIQCNEPRLAIDLYVKITHHSAHMDCYVFAALLKAVAKLRDLERGYQLHENILKKGFLDVDLALGNTLIGMYVECGLLLKAQEVFDNLPTRDVVSWTMLVGGHCKHSQCIEALECFQQMQIEGIYPNNITFVCALKACGKIGNLSQGEKIHAEIYKKHELERDPLVSSALIDMYIKCNSVAKAVKVSDNLYVRDVVSWTALISGHVKHGHLKEALHFYEKMKLEGICPNSVTLVCCLKACGSAKNLEKGREIHIEIMMKGLLVEDLTVGNTLIDMYAKCGQLTEAKETFDRLRNRDVVSWNALITGYMKCGCGKEVLNCYEAILSQGIYPDAVTYLCSLKACSIIGDGEKGKELHAEIARNGLLDTDVSLNKALVDMYAGCSLFANALEVFEELPVQDMIAWTALIAGYVKHDNGEEALNCFDQMKLEGVSPDAVTYISIFKACGNIGEIKYGEGIYCEIVRLGFVEDLVISNAVMDMYGKCGLVERVQEIFDSLVHHDIVSWTVLISGYAKHGYSKEALKCFDKMQLEGFSPDAATIVCLLKACGDIGAVEKGIEIHALIDRKGLLQKDSEIAVGNALISMYAKCGLLVKAQEVFDRLPAYDVISWTALIAGYAETGEAEEAFHVFNKMRKVGERPDIITFLSVMAVCSHVGLVNKGQEYFETMSKEYGISPTSEHLSCQVDLLSRTGHLDRAFAVIKEMQFCPSFGICRTMLDGSRRFGNIEVGKEVFDHVITTGLQP